jgi:uncharacterized protein YcfL
MNTTFRRPIAALLLAALATLAGGCNTANTVQPIDEKRVASDVAYRQIVTNGWLKYKANVASVRESVVNGDMKRVAVDVYSDQLTTQRFSYRFDWSDDAGMPVGSPTASMMPVTIKPKETITITAVSPSPAAKQWRLTFLDQNR